jgi:hypothetical protein
LKYHGPSKWQEQKNSRWSNNSGRKKCQISYRKSWYPRNIRLYQIWHSILHYASNGFFASFHSMDRRSKCSSRNQLNSEQESCLKSLKNGLQ